MHDGWIGGDTKIMMTKHINFAIMPTKEGNGMGNLAIIRKSKGFTQAELAKMSGLTQPYIANVESGKVNIENVSLKNGLILSSVLGCRMEDLIDSREQIVAETHQRSVKVLRDTEERIRADRKLMAMQKAVSGMEKVQ